LQHQWWLNLGKEGRRKLLAIAMPTIDAHLVHLDHQVTMALMVSLAKLALQAFQVSLEITQPSH